jgi:asparagine synthase (glutamine-hydrolysing)
MCGIAGLVLNAHRDSTDVHARLLAMREAMTHRGPDDSGAFLSADGRVGMVNRRLAIRDLSSAGRMPMMIGNGALWITYNGEVYNAGELRGDLETLGYEFQSGSDTEVILHGYQAWGADVVLRLRGMFAFAIYDERVGIDRPRPGSLLPKGRRLLLARDRLGIKPLYYASMPDGLVFGSELKAIIASGFVGRGISPEALLGYLLLGSVPSPLTIYDGIRALPSSCWLDLEIGDTLRPPVLRRYWNLPTEADEPAAGADTVAMVRHALYDAVRSHLVSNVPVGAFLSGGLDSSVVVALMRAVTTGPIRTCSTAFEEVEYNEAPFARAMADAVGAEHHERVVTPREVLNELDRIVWAMDQPTIDGVNTYFVSKTAREAGLTVALSGLGGDELFGGYANTFDGVPRVTQAVRLAQIIPGAVPLARLGLGLLPGPRPWRKLGDALARPASPASAYLACRGLFSPSEARALVGPDLWKAAWEAFDPIQEIAERAAPDGSLFSWVSRAELRTYTHHQLLRDTDVMSMAHSLEVRVPFLDHRLLETVLRLPESTKRERGKPKSLLVRAVADLLPEVIRARRDKRGFVFPFDTWLRGPLRATSLEWQAGLTDLLVTEAVTRVQRAYEDGRVHWSRPWALAVLQGWRLASDA